MSDVTCRLSASISVLDGRWFTCLVETTLQFLGSDYLGHFSSCRQCRNLIDLCRPTVHDSSSYDECHSPAYSMLAAAAATLVKSPFCLFCNFSEDHKKTQPILSH